MVDFDKVSEVKKATIQLFSNQWLKNFERNRGAVRRNPGIKAFGGRFTGIPAIVVGAGPSLDKNIKYLRAAGEKALIIACDAALRVLTQEGIVPDFVTILDPQKEILRFFEGVKTAHLNLIAPTIVHPQVVEAWQGRTIYYNKFAPDIPVLTRIQRAAPNVGELIPGGTVLSISYSFAFQSGANPITFIGQDLCYPPGGSYSRGTVYDGVTRENMLERHKENIVDDRDMFGAVVPTIKSMFVTKQWMEWAFTTWKRKNPVEIMNSTEGGILREKCRLLPLREFIILYCGKKYNFPWTIQKLFKHKF